MTSLNLMKSRKIQIIMKTIMIMINSYLIDNNNSSISSNSCSRSSGKMIKTMIKIPRAKRLNSLIIIWR